MKTRDCGTESWRRLLGAHVDGHLSSRDEALVASHLTGCPRCRREVEFHELVAQAIADLPVWSAPPEVQEAVLARTIGAPRPWSLRIHRLQPILRLALVASIVFGSAALLSATGFVSAMFSPVAALARTGSLWVKQLVVGLVDLPGPLQKLEILAKIGQTVTDSFRVVMDAPPPDFVWGTALTALLAVLAGASLVALRAERRIPHVR